MRSLSIPSRGLGSAPARLPGLQKVWDKGYDGEGVGIAVLDSGLQNISDFEDRVVAWHDTSGRMEQPHDFVGHGTMTAACAAGNGHHKGVATGADIIAVATPPDTKAMERGVEWVLENREKHNIRVLNISMGSAPSQENKRLAELCQQAVKAGIFVCAAMGNFHGQAPANSPAHLPEVFGVGAYDDRGTASLADDDVARFSNRGNPETLPNKPDVLAPGVNVSVPLPKNTQIARNELRQKIRTRTGRLASIPEIRKQPWSGSSRQSGTSQATPYVSGLAAILIQANPELTPAEVGDIIRNTASAHLPRESWEQGAGLVRADLALEEALRQSGA